MDQQPSFFNWSLKKLLDTEPDKFGKSRIKILYVILLITLLKVLILLPIAYYYGQWFQLGRGIFFGVFYGVMLKLLLRSKSSVILISHIALWGGIVLVWTNIFVTAIAINIITTQMIFMIIVSSFYLLNLRYGVIYSIISSFPVVIFLVLFGKERLGFYGGSGELASPAYEIIVILNFVTIALSHFLFQQAFNENSEEKEILNQELQKAVDKANISAQSKSYFLSTMSHELRTPLNSVIGMTELLMDAPHNKEQEDNLKILNFSAVSLHALINDILDFNKIDSDKLTLESIRVNLNELVESICAGLRIQAGEKGLKLILNVDESVIGKYVISDPTRITQIIYNLVGNGIKFTRKGSVTVSLKTLMMDENNMTIRFSVADTGIGISLDKHETIFEPFTQASRDTTRNFGGTGLGLAIVKRLLNLFNSAIYLESTSNNGSNFYFDIAFAVDRKPVEDNAPNDVSFSELAGLRILVAEDNPINVLLVKKILTKWEINPVFAVNGKEAVEKASSEVFDVILMDIHMPVMDGYEATREIRAQADPVKASVPIIALTASVSNLSDKIKEVDINDFIYKPFNSRELYMKIKRVNAE